MTKNEIKRLAKRAIINNLESTLILSMEEIHDGHEDFNNDDFQELESEVINQYNRVIDLLS